MMGFDPALWAMKDAPVVDVEEWAVLVCMAEHADDDGCNSMPSQSTIANRTKTSVPTVKRRIASLAERGVIARGDQTVAERYPADRRPVVWDLMIPFSWFPNIERIQEYRRGKGRQPLTPGMRPDLPVAPEKKRRVDAGVTRGGRSTRAGGLEDPWVSESGGSCSDERGVLKSTTGVQEDPQPSQVTLPIDTPQGAAASAAPKKAPGGQRKASSRTHRNTATPEARIANAIYDHSQGQVSWEGMQQIGKRALFVAGATEDSVMDAMRGLWDAGKPIIQQTVGQVLSGVLDRNGRPVQAAQNGRARDDPPRAGSSVWDRVAQPSDHEKESA